MVVKAKVEETFVEEWYSFLIESLRDILRIIPLFGDSIINNDMFILISLRPGCINNGKEKLAKGEKSKT